MPRALITRILICLSIAAPAVVLRILGIHPDPVLSLLVFGAAVVAASFLLAWAVEAAQKDISGTLAIAILALIAILPEYAVDLYYAFRPGSDLWCPGFACYHATASKGATGMFTGYQRVSRLRPCRPKGRLGIYTCYSSIPRVFIGEIKSHCMQND